MLYCVYTNLNLAPTTPQPYKSLYSMRMLMYCRKTMKFSHMMVVLRTGGVGIVSCPAIHGPQQRTSGVLKQISCHLIWNVHEMSYEITECTIKSCTPSKFKMVASILFQGLQFLCKREKSVVQRSCFKD